MTSATPPSGNPSSDPGNGPGSTLGTVQLAVDIGGTFTDLVVRSSGGADLSAKSLSTPDNPADGVFAVLNKAAQHLNTDVEDLLSSCRLFVLGTTSATNTMLEMNGAKVGLVCTEGFRDDLAIRRGYIPRSQDFRTPFPVDLVRRYLRLAVRERIDAAGKVAHDLDETNVLQIAKTFAAQGVDAVAVSLFNAFLNPVHERRVRDLVGEVLPQAYISISSDVLPVLGEYPRVSTTVVNAYVAPRTINRLQTLMERVKESGFAGDLFIMQNNGGIIDTRLAQRRPVLMLLSGPAAGAPGAQMLSAHSADHDFILFDMGGTSTDITVLRADLPLIADEFDICGYHVFTPAVDVHTVAAGGGAIAWIDSGGMPRIGPRSAGANPGPAAVGAGGTEATVTDANLLLGRLDPDAYFGGEIQLDHELAEQALAPIATALAMSTKDAALSVTRVAEARMASAVQSFCMRKGVDPREFALISAGGAGGLHAAAIAQLLGISRVYIPRAAAVFCAMGMLHANLRRDFVHSCFQALGDATAAGLNAELERLRGFSAEEMGTTPWPTTHIRYEFAFAMQYQGQQSQVDVPAPDRFADADVAALEDSFHRLHEARYGHRRDASVVQLVRASLTVIGELPEVDFEKVPAANGAPTAHQHRLVGFHSGEWCQAAVFSLMDILAGATIAGPAVVEGNNTTILVPPGTSATCTDQGTLIIDL